MSETLSSLRSRKRPSPRWVQRISYWFRPYDHVTEEDEQSGKTPRFRHLANAVELWGMLAVVISAVFFAFPRFFHAQLSAGPLVFLLTVIAILLLVTAPSEWLFHRFGMHGMLVFRIVPWLKIEPEEGLTGLRKAARRALNTFRIKCIYYIAKISFGHGAHHKKTDVTPVNPTRLAEIFNAISKYEITNNGQTEHAVFPHFSILIFFAVFLPIFAIMQLASSLVLRLSGHAHMQLPILLAAAVAITWQIWAYENGHAIMHKRYTEWWKPRMTKGVFRSWYSVAYRFHFFHHMNEKCSLGVVGAVWFWYPWDRLFGTYKLARLELIDAASLKTDDVMELGMEEIRLLPGACPQDFAKPGPVRGWITALDVQTEKAQAQFNEFFVAALKEVRRRRALGEQAPQGMPLPENPGTLLATPAKRRVRRQPSTY